MSLGVGLSGTEWGGPCTSFWSICEGIYIPGRPGRCWAVGESPVLGWRCPRPTQLPQPGGKIISSSHWAETSDLLHL